MPTVQSVLKRARSSVSRKWVNHYPFRGQCCTLTAIAYATPNCIGWEYLQNGCHSLLGFIIDIESVDGILQWNDDSDRTKAEVLQAFDAAINVAKTLGV